MPSNTWIFLYVLFNYFRNATNDFDNLDYKSWIPVFMTLVNDVCYTRSLTMIESVLKYYPESKIIFYDAGLNGEQISDQIPFLIIIIIFRRKRSLIIQILNIDFSILVHIQPMWDILKHMHSREAFLSILLNSFHIKYHVWKFCLKNICYGNKIRCLI